MVRPSAGCDKGFASLQIGAQLLLRQILTTRAVWAYNLPLPGCQFKAVRKKRTIMLGEQIGESKGKRLVRRVLSVDPPTAEVSFEDSGQMLGVATTGMGTYTSIVSPDGTIHGDGQGMNMTADGEAITWTGTGVGRFGPGGSVSYRGMLFFRTASQKLARLNGTCGAFEYEVDAAGSTISKVWEWK
jgi:hypothetical protein